MKVIILGAAGKLGRRLVESCLARGHEVTAAARNSELITASNSQPGRLRKMSLDLRNTAELEAALAGHDAMMSAAGNVEDGDKFVELFDNIATAAERVLGDRRRVWMLAGAGILDVPGTGRIGLDLPFVPKFYRPHLENWRRLELSRLDWALMCPGPMTPGDEQRKDEGLRTSVDALPVDVWPWARYAPGLALSLLFRSQLPRLTVPYRSVADVMTDNLEADGWFSQRRVGIGWAGPHSLKTGAA